MNCRFGSLYFLEKASEYDQEILHFYEIRTNVVINKYYMSAMTIVIRKELVGLIHKYGNKV